MITPGRQQPEMFPSEEVVELRAILGVLRRQYRVLAYAVAAGLAAAALFLTLAQERFSAAALIEVQPKGQGVLQVASERSPQTVDENARIDSEVEILRSDAIALAVIDDLGLVADQQFQPRPALFARLSSFVGRANASGPRANAELYALERFHDAIDIRRKGLTYLISVSATAQQPERARDLANRIAEMHISQQVRAKIDATLAARDVLIEQIDVARARLDASEARYDRFIFDRFREFEQSGALDGALVSRLDANRLSANALDDLAVETRAAIQAQNWEKTAVLLEDPELARLAQDKLAEEPGFSTALGELDARLRDRTTQQLNEIERELDVLEQEAVSLRTGLREDLNFGELPSEMVTELYTIRQDASVARNQYDVLLGQMREIEAEAGLQLASTRIVSPAVLPVRPSFPDPGLVLLFALGASASLGVALAFLNEYFVGGVTTEAQLSAVTGVPAAGSIPFVDETSGGRFSPADRIVDMPLTGYAEAFRNIRAAIDQGLRGIAGIGRGAGEGQVIVVTSAQSGEGKTTAALALARTYAAAGKKTLLIDADLRRPSIHHQLGVAPVSGFGQYLRAPDDMKGPQDFYARDPASNLALILGAERAQESTDNLLNSAGFADIIGQARSVYDVTIIDTPPVLQVVDARYVVPFADAVILAVRWASTGQTEIKAAVGPIRKAMGESAMILPVLTQTNLTPRSSAYDLYQGNYSAAT